MDAVKYGINLQETMNNKNKKTNTLTSNATVIQASKELKKVSQSLYFGIRRGNDSDNESGDNGSVENPLMKCKDVLPLHENWNYDEEQPPSKSAKNKTAILVKCGCPTADGWVDDKKSKNGRGKKRKAGGHEDPKQRKKEKNEPLCICGDRPRDVKNGNATILHCCDYNPYCLASLGGIVDQYRQSAAQIRYAAKISNKRKPSAPRISRQVYDNLSNKLKEEKILDDEVRTSILVDSDVITNYVSSNMCRVGEAKAFVECIKSCHQPLLFKPDQSSASSQSSSTDNGTVELSQPSGLLNLGATCYLNSQLQCLAQNLGFIHGLFSWKKPTETVGDERMTEVLSHLRTILSEMRYGPDRVLCTNELASALGLEHDEMQDPNEFARLLFDRMDDSFKQSTEISSSTNGSFEQRGLGELLPSVFGGTTQNVTSCSVCGTESTTSEDYMELQIPIVDEGMKKAGRKLKKDRGKPTAPDVDVQHCVDVYLFPERLVGENQYECSQCRKKVDATRRMRIAKLPPVLNLQLARYAFDRSKLSKRKLTTAVLLPKSLEIPSTATTKQNEHSRYILCAVQYHLGPSAHGGHYVAEVMDWTTGVWYKFNDKEVTRLEGGPESSFDPSTPLEDITCPICQDTPSSMTQVAKISGCDHRFCFDCIDKWANTGNKCPLCKKRFDKWLDIKPAKKRQATRQVYGSQDAYNLFYVEQTYLARHAKDELSQCMISESSGNGDSILSTVNKGRNSSYRLKRERLLRLTAREKLVVENQLFNGSNESKVWVEADFLRRFLSREDGLEELFCSAMESNTLFKSKSFLCEHSRGLDPRKARQGKLLSMEMYDALESILRHEYTMFLDDRSEDTKLARQLTLMDHKFIDGENLTCQECGKAYQKETTKKYALFDKLILINDGLLSKLNDITTVDETEDSPDIYVVSRKWCTSYKNLIANKVKEMKDSPFSGAEELINLIRGGRTDNSAEAYSKTDIGDDNPTSRITCVHGKCSVMHNSQKRRLITGDMWRIISEVFPEAVAHKYEHPRDDALGSCQKCLLENEEDGQDKSRAKKDTPKGPLCKIHIHEIDNGLDIVVATSLIMLEISSDQETQQTSSNGRPKRSRKARGDEGSFPTLEIEMALDGNLAHFKLLLNQKGKKLFDQRLFLISPGSSVEAQELTKDSDRKTMKELVASISSDVKETSTTADCELHMALTYGSSNSSSDTTKPNSRKRVSRQEEETELLVALLGNQCGGWMTTDGNDVVVGGKKTKRRRQERGFEGTFLQSTELTPPSEDDGSDAKDVNNEDGTSLQTNSTSPSTNKTATDINRIDNEEDEITAAEKAKEALEDSSDNKEAAANASSKEMMNSESKTTEVAGEEAEADSSEKSITSSSQELPRVLENGKRKFSEKEGSSNVAVVAATTQVASKVAPPSAQDDHPSDDTATLQEESVQTQKEATVFDNSKTSFITGISVDHRTRVAAENMLLLEQQYRNQNIELQSQGTVLSSHSNAFTPTPSHTQRTYTDDGSDAKDAKNEDGTCPPMNNTLPPNARDDTRLVRLTEAMTEMNSMQEVAANVITAGGTAFVGKSTVTRVRKPQSASRVRTPQSASQVRKSQKEKELLIEKFFHLLNELAPSSTFTLEQLSNVLSEKKVFIKDNEVNIRRLKEVLGIFEAVGYMSFDDNNNKYKWEGKSNLNDRIQKFYNGNVEPTYHTHKNRSNLFKLCRRVIVLFLKENLKDMTYEYIIDQTCSEDEEKIWKINPRKKDTRWNTMYTIGTTLSVVGFFERTHPFSRDKKNKAGLRWKHDINQDTLNEYEQISCRDLCIKMGLLGETSGLKFS